MKIKLPGSSAFVALTEGQQIPVGTIVDATKGRVTIVAAADKNGGTATADFYGGIFKLGQTNGRDADHDAQAGREAELRQERQEGERGGEKEEEAPPVGRRQG